MDAERFDTWTRRRFGFAAGGLAAVLAGLAPIDAKTAQRKRCKKRKRRCGSKCVTGNCCPGKRCGGDDFCRCGRTIDGKTFCFEPLMAVCEQCDSNAACMAPLRCVKIDDCGPPITAICLPPCRADV